MGDSDVTLTQSQSSCGELLHACELSKDNHLVIMDNSYFLDRDQLLCWLYLNLPLSIALLSVSLHGATEVVMVCRD